MWRATRLTLYFLLRVCCLHYTDAQTQATLNILGELHIGHPDECSGAEFIIEELEGTLWFPPVNDVVYDPNCHWSLIINSGNQPLTLEFESFSMGSGDNLTISNTAFGGSYDVTFTFDNPASLAPISGFDDIVKISFAADDVSEATGCKIQWYQTPVIIETTPSNGLPQDTVFRSILAGETETISSPNYPGNYPSDRDFYWVLTAAEGERIRASFTDFALSLDDDISFYEGIVKSPQTQRAKYTGAKTSLPSPVVSLYNQIMIIFHSSKFVTDKGFSLRCSIFVPSDPVTTTEEKKKKDRRPLTEEGRTVIIVICLLACLLLAIVLIYIFYWKPKQKQEEQQIARELYDNGKEPLTEDKIPQRPTTASQAARLRAEANIKRNYGMELERSGTHAQLTMRDRILLASQQQAAGQRPITAGRRPPTAQPGPTRSAGMTNGQAPNPLTTAADVEATPEPGWSKKLDSQHLRKQRPSGSDQTISPRNQKPSTLQQPKLPEISKPTANKTSLPPITQEVGSETKQKKKKNKKPTPAGTDEPDIIKTTTPRPNSARSGSGLKTSRTAPADLNTSSSNLPGYVLRSDDEEDVV